METEDNTEPRITQLAEVSASDRENATISDNQRGSTESKQEKKEEIPEAVGGTHHTKDVENENEKKVLKTNDAVSGCQALVTKVQNKKQDQNCLPVNDPIGDVENKAVEKAKEEHKDNLTEDQDKEVSDRKEKRLEETKKLSTIDKHLQVPKPIEKTKRAKAGPSTSAISSKAWRDYYINKDNEKLEKENIKKRKREEIEKRKLEKASKNKKKLKPKDKNEKPENLNRKKVKCARCSDVLERDAEEGEKNVGCDICPRWFHLNCTKMAGEIYDSLTNKEFYCDFCSESENSS